MIKLERKDPLNLLTEEEAKIARLTAHISEKISSDDERLDELDEEEKLIYLLRAYQGHYLGQGVAAFFFSPMALIRSEIEWALERVGALKTLSSLRRCAKIIHGGSDPELDEHESLTKDEQERRLDEATAIGDNYEVEDELEEKVSALVLKHFSERGYELVD
jgi:hypothetical protein